MPNAKKAIELGQKISGKSMEIEVLAAMGIALERPAYGYLFGDEFVLEMEVAAPEKLDVSIDLGLAQKRGRKLEAPAGERAAELILEKRRLYVLRAGNSVWISPAQRDWPSTAIAAARAARKPVMPKWVEGTPVAYFSTRGMEGVERAEAAIFADGKKIRVQGQAMLDFTTGLLIGDLAAAPGQSRVLIERTDRVAELTAYIAPSMVMNIFEMEGLPLEHTKIASGRVHAILSADGKLRAAIETKEGTSKEAAASMKEVLAAKYPFVELATVEAKKGEDRAPIEVRVKPSKLLDALEARTKAKLEPRLLRQDLAAGRAAAGGLLSRVSFAKAELSFGPGTVNVRAELEY
jgi:hypothetical protein